ncbi:MAG: aspartate kinase [Lachnospiraceae bacterium]|nr:aspartate kinase [Lachnospiraceae bacterium]
MSTTTAKFGGTSIADAAHFRKIGEIVAKDPARRFLVVSAPGKRNPSDLKVTDLLLSVYEKAAAEENFEPVLLSVRDRFFEIVRGLFSGEQLEQEEQMILDTLRVLRDSLLSDPQKDYAASRGEYLAARILSDYLGYTFVDPEWCVCFSEDGVLDLPMTLRTMGAALRPLQNAVIAGFYGADQKGIIHTFERGGSDVTGALAARAVSADLYENWTDVPGLLSADPRIVKNPGTVDYLSYRELRTLSYMGASVLHTDSVLPASNIGIPINIRSTEEPDNPGTMIVRKLPKGRMRHAVTGVAGRTGMSVIQVEKVMTSDGSGFASNILESLKRRNLPFEHCLTGIDTITLVIRSDLLTPVKEALLQELQDELQPDYLSIRDELSMIAVVGEKGTDASDANVQVLQVLTRAGIEITTINQGAGKLNLLIGVPEEHYEDAIRAIYSVIEEETA